MQNLDFDRPLQKGSPVLVSGRGSHLLLYSRETGSVSVVNRAGLEAWNLFATPQTPREAVRALGKNHGWTTQRLAEFFDFVFAMIARGFLVTEKSSSMSAATEATDALPAADGALSELYLHMTNRCNLRCAYCYNAIFRENASTADELNLDEICRVLDQAAGLSVKRVVFTGGEPLLRRDCLDAARYARSVGLTTSCLTNGTLIASMADGIADAFDQIIVSLDSWRVEEQEMLRPGGNMKGIVAGIRSLVDSGKTKVWIRPVITRFNVDSLPAFPKFVSLEAHCSDFMVALCLPTHLGNVSNFDLLPSPEAYRQALQKFHAAIAETKGSTSLTSIPLETVGRCGAGTGLLSIAPNGDVYPCQCLHDQDFKAGNIRREDLGEIVKNSRVLIKLRAHRQPRFTACADCPIVNLCSLTCRAVQHAFGKAEPLYAATMCPFARLEAEERLWSEADRMERKKTGPERCSSPEKGKRVSGKK